MDVKQRGKLERYFKNSRRFLWGLTLGNQKETYAWLRKKGFEFGSGTYGHVTGQLLEKPGVERILKDLIIPGVNDRFSGKAIDFLRDCWQVGARPDISFLKLYNIKDAAPFLEINLQFNYVERWGEFAGVWFEEIEPLQESLN
ncbi:MAG: hypothetical protein J7M30_09085 [Deltaproteobacteria bacterium]|nr:hypothetical protein [Deltaproteobacteria bacterium]